MARTNFDPFDNNDIRYEKQRRLESKKRKRQLIRYTTVVSFLFAAILILCAFIRPDLFSLFGFPKISSHLSRFFPEQLDQYFSRDDTNTKNVSTDNSNHRASQPIYVFTQDQIDKAKKEILNKSEPLDIGGIIQQNKDGDFRYQVELVAGRRIYADKATVKNDSVSFENNRGLVVSLPKTEIKDIVLLKKSDKK